MIVVVALCFILCRITSHSSNETVHTDTHAQIQIQIFIFIYIKIYSYSDTYNICMDLYLGISHIQLGNLVREKSESSPANTMYVSIYICNDNGERERMRKRTNCCFSYTFFNCLWPVELYYLWRNAHTHMHAFTYTYICCIKLNALVY